MMKNLNRWNTYIYMLNLAILMSHQADSAYWKEWNLFGMPGDIQGFLLLNFLLTAIFFTGLALLFSENKSSYLFALLLSASGIFAFIIHMYFMSAGFTEFTSTASVIILYATLIVSSGQILMILFIFNKKNKWIKKLS